MNMIGLPRDFLNSLKERRKTITAREFRRIIKDDVNHPCNVLITKPTEHHYDLRTRNILSLPIVRSGTEKPMRET